MTPAPADDDAWLALSRRSAEAVRAILAAHPTTAERAVETGTGEGGDRTLVIDQQAEDAIFAELDALHANGTGFTAVSEERGEVSFGDPDLRVVIDPIDGSLNAKRGMPNHALSIAVADGPTMEDVRFGFVHDFGPGESWWALRGQGAWLARPAGALDAEPDEVLALDPSLPERRWRDGRLELLGVESADPRWVAQRADELVDAAHRLRAIGALALTLTQVAAARLDAMVSLKACRAVDVAAAQLIAREGGALVAFPGYDDPLGAPLDLAPHSPIAAARSPEALAMLTAWF